MFSSFTVYPCSLCSVSSAARSCNNARHIPSDTCTRNSIPKRLIQIDSTILNSKLAVNPESRGHNVFVWLLEIILNPRGVAALETNNINYRGIFAISLIVRFLLPSLQQYSIRQNSSTHSIPNPGGTMFFHPTTSLVLFRVYSTGITQSQIQGALAC